MENPIDIYKYFLTKCTRSLLTSSSSFGTFVLELPVSELSQISFHRLLSLSSFWNNKDFRENRSERRLKLRQSREGQHIPIFDFYWSKFDL